MSLELENALRFYIDGKKLIKTDKKKTLELFKKSLENITKFKLLQTENLDNEKLNILTATENECKKYIENYKDIFSLISQNDIYQIKNLPKILERNIFVELNSKGNTILHHCIDIGDNTILKELLKKGGNINQVNNDGHTLLEYACLKKDPNMINYLITLGANLKKHIYFRGKDKVLFLTRSDIDAAIILKVIINNSKKSQSNELFSFLSEYLSWNQLIGLENYTVKDLSYGLSHMFKNKKSFIHYKNIINDDLNLFKSSNIKKSYDKIDIIIFNLIPFISFPFNISNNYIIKNELKFLIKKNIKKNPNNYKEIILNDIFDIYIKSELYTEDFIGILICQILNKLNI